MKKLMRSAALSALVAFSSVSAALADDDLFRESNPLMDKKNWSGHEFYIGYYALSAMRAIVKHDVDGLLATSLEERSDFVLGILDSYPSFRSDLRVNSLDRMVSHYKLDSGADQLSYHMAFCQEGLLDDRRNQAIEVIEGQIGRSEILDKQGYDALFDYIERDDRLNVYLNFHILSHAAQLKGMNPKLAYCNQSQLLAKVIQ